MMVHLEVIIIIIDDGDDDDDVMSGDDNDVDENDDDDDEDDDDDLKNCTDRANNCFMIHSNISHLKKCVPRSM